jgi:glutathione S-transferase
MKLFGTRTSPYVRRVRIVAQLTGAPLELVDTFTKDGQAALREASPIWKVPVLETEAGPLYDSRVIIDYLIERFDAKAALVPPPRDRFRDANRISVIDGALDAAINVFYLRRDGADPQAIPYLQKQLDRVTSAMEWIESDLAANQSSPPAGLAEIALVTTVDWMRFRNAYPTERHPATLAFCERAASAPAFRSTAPEA